MTLQFRVETSPHFDRMFRKLASKHPELPDYLATIRTILRTDPYNRTRQHPIKKLAGRKATASGASGSAASVFATI